MFADPMSVTYDGAVRTLPRTSEASRPGVSRVVSQSRYRSADDEFTVEITESSMGGDMRRFEVILERTQQDSDGPFVGSWTALPNRFGFVFEINNLRYNSVTDLPLLQSAITSLVDGPFRARLIGGEK